jgi:hypothetical protein
MYILDEEVTTVDMAAKWTHISEIIPNWSDGWCYERLLNLKDICDEKSIRDPLVDSLLDDYSGFGHTLTEIRWPENLREIEEMAFWGCVSLKSVTIPGTVQAVKDDELYNGVEHMWNGGCGYGAFGYCTSLEEFCLAEGANYIGNNVLKGNKQLKKIVLPASLEQVGGRIYDEFDLILYFNQDFVPIRLPLDKLNRMSHKLH